MSERLAAADKGIKSKVALYHCDSEKQIPEIVHSIIDVLGREKVATLFRNKKVLLKPNVCVDLPPERGATTHPAVLDAVIGLAKDFGAHVIVGDGAAVGVRGKPFKVTGVEEVCQRHGVELIDFNRQPGKTVTLANALAFHEVSIANTYFEIDTLVNLPAFKSSIIFWLTGALKNIKGLLTGKEKHRAHRLGVPECVADLNRIVRQDLIIMDGFVGMMGNGPIAGEPANAKLLMGGFDPVAIDVVEALLMGLPVAEIPMINLAAQAGVGSLDYELVGDPIASFHIDFLKPLIARDKEGTALLTAYADASFEEMKKKGGMVINFDKCDLCLRCRDACPFGAITFAKETKTITIDREKCVWCLCCTEVCTSLAIHLEGIPELRDTHNRVDQLLSK